MFGIGMPELLLIMIVGLVVLGPEKLPEVGRAVGKGIREFRRASSAFSDIINAQPEEKPEKDIKGANEKEKAPAKRELKQDENALQEEKVDGAEEDRLTTPKPSGLAAGYEPPTRATVAKQLEEQKNA